MNERDAVIFAAIARWTSPHGSTAEDAIGYAEKYFIPAARKRGLFDEPAPDLSPLTPTGADQLARAERDLDAAKALLREMDDFISRECSLIAGGSYDRRVQLHQRMKEITND